MPASAEMSVTKRHTLGGDLPMLSPEFLVQVNRRMKGRKVKAFGLNAMRVLGLRHLVIRMDTINLCNLRCKMCYYSSDYNRRKEEMDLPLFRKIAEQVFPKTRFLYLSCATEPTMNKQFASIVRTTGEYGVPFTSFCTNGQMLREDVIQACIDAKISEIIFSVDGATAETYEEIRRGGKWGRLLEKLDLLASMKQRAGAKNPVTRINFTCMLSNIHELPAMVRFAAEHGAGSLHVRHLLSYTDEQNSCREQMSYLKVFNGFAEEAKNEARSRGIDLFLPDPVSSRQHMTGKTCLTDPSQLEANQYCLLPWMQAIISWNGDYRVCSTHRKLGNFREQTFEEIYNSPKMREIRRKMLWRSADSCSWNCREEAYEAPELDNEPQGELVSIAPSMEG
jgi:MoaA/NifB/PqqE/SkfB family radical SAM enzyme